MEVPIIPTPLDLIERHEQFVRSGLWPSGHEALNTEGWLKNFSPGRDEQIACSLLDSFLYFDEKITTKLFLSAFHTLSSIVEDIGDAVVHTGSRWTKFLTEEVLVSYPSGSNFETVGSGAQYARLIRDNTSIPERQILTSQRLVPKINSSQRSPSIVFVDDFAGTGKQFTDTWERRIRTGVQDEHLSLADLQAMESQIKNVYYVVAVSTQAAIDRIKKHAPNVRVISSYVLDDTFRANSSSSKLVDAELLSSLPDFLARYTAKSGHEPSAAYGFGKGGYAIGLGTSIPDNCLKILNAAGTDSWTPLLGGY